MMNTVISAHIQLTPEQLHEVTDLTYAIRAHGIDPRISVEWLGGRTGPHPSEWLAYVDGRLVGLASISTFDGTSEITMAIHDAPVGTADQLFDTVLAALPAQGVRRALLLHDRAEHELRTLAETRGLALDHAEHVMRRSAEAAPVAIPVGPLHVAKATAETLPVAAQVMAADWGGDPQEVLVRAQSNIARGGVDYYLATYNDTPVAALNIQWLEERPWIYGFSVSSAYRGRGFGRQTLAVALAEALAHSPGEAFLEVEPDNTVALNLYQSLGFAVLRTFDYWAKELADGTNS